MSGVGDGQQSGTVFGQVQRRQSAESLKPGFQCDSMLETKLRRKFSMFEEGEPVKCVDGD
ncbi:hypothetical protein [Rhodoferax ferrireducens]|uniref:hypothetical protein n=1 Tax=Rhodoferax ferrireducens TaxID=192843 RepID=UPI003BB810CB